MPTNKSHRKEFSQEEGEAIKKLRLEGKSADTISAIMRCGKDRLRRFEGEVQLAFHLDVGKLAVVPDIGLQSGIQAVRMTLPRVYFDAERCREGIEALKQYQREYDEDKKAYRQNPRHDWTSHPAGAFRMLAVSWQEISDKTPALEPKPLMVGPANTVTLNDMWQVHDRTVSRRARI